MRRGVVYFFYLVVFLLLLALPSLVRRVRFYGFDMARQEEAPVFEPADLSVRVPTPAAGTFEDEPEAGDGLVLLDVAHENLFELAEISFLDSRLAARGYELVPFADGDLASALRPVDSLVVVAPMAEYSAAEVQAVSDFVARGGRLLLIGDPTRFSFDFGDESDSFIVNPSLDTDQIPLNSLANEFDLVFNGDYLYNTVENEGNFRNIVLQQSGMGESDLTEDVDKLAFYGSHSIQLGRDSQPILTGDDNTWSSATDRPGGLALAALDGSKRVLAIGDIDFLSEPYHTVFDNGRFVAHLADFLTADDRDHVLADFPYFYDEVVEVVYAGDPELGPSAFENVILLQEAFRNTGRRLELTDQPSGDGDVLYLGLYNQAAEVEEILAEAGISLVIDPAIEEEKTDEESAASGASNGEGEETDAQEEVVAVDDSTAAEEKEIRQVKSDLGNVQMSGTALVTFDRDGDARRVVVLASSGEGLANVTNRLADLIPVDATETLLDCLLDDGLALCPTNVTDEVVEAELKAVDTSEAEEAPSEGEEQVEPETGDGGLDLTELGAELRGSIGLDESVEDTLEADLAHAWTFAEGPELVNITLQGGEDLDGVLELYDPNGEFVISADSAFVGEEERLELIEISGDGAYTIIVRDFFNDGGDYTLTVEGVGPEELGVVERGELAPGESVDDTLGEEELHAWTFEVGEPVSVNITLISAAEMDGFLILFDPENEPVSFADDGLSGEDEIIEGVSLDAAGVYTVVVGDFLSFGGDYSLLLEVNE